jgi:hypothetical protein
MLVAVCHTKAGPSGESICEAFARGVRASGDVAIEVRSRYELRALSACDTIVQVGDVNPHSLYTHADAASLFRQEAADRCGELGIRRIVIDTGFLSNQRLWPIVGRPEADRYYSVGLDGTKGNVQYYHEGSPPDRWRQLGIELLPWRTRGDNVLIRGQMRFSASTYHLDILQWYVDVAERIRELTDWPIVLRAHPNQTLLPEIDVRVFRIRTNRKMVEITTDLENAWCVVTKTSNGAVDAIVHGIPVITDDSLCMAHAVAEHDLSNINSPRQADREAWLHDWPTRNGTSTRWRPACPGGIYGRTFMKTWQQLASLAAKQRVVPALIPRRVRPLRIP